MLGPAESCAAAYCWLARWRTGQPASPLDTRFEEVDRLWHGVSCRFCDTPLPELMDMIDEAKDLLEREPTSPQQAAWASFKKLSHKDRVNRIREAQQRPWYEEVTG